MLYLFRAIMRCLFLGYIFNYNALIICFSCIVSVVPHYVNSIMNHFSKQIIIMQNFSGFKK